MIRAATGKPSSTYKKDEKKVFRPSSANAKLQSYAYVDLNEEPRPSSSIAKKTTPFAEVATSQPHLEKSKPRLGKVVKLNLLFLAYRSFYKVLSLYVHFF